MKTYTHDQLCSECFQYTWNKYPQTRQLFFHIPNEQRPFPGESRHHHMIRLQQAKAVGVVKGVLDFVFYWKGIMYVFDAKVGKDSLSVEQRLFIRQVEGQGGKFYEIRDTPDDFFRIFDLIMSY